MYKTIFDFEPNVHKCFDILNPLSYKEGTCISAHMYWGGIDRSPLGLILVFILVFVLVFIVKGLKHVQAPLLPTSPTFYLIYFKIHLAV